MIWALAAVFLARSYSLEGLVVEVDAAARRIVVSHKEVAGVMPAMVMPVVLKDARQSNGIVPGTRVSFEYTPGEAVKRLRVLRAANEIEQDGKRILLPAAKEQVAVGNPVPDFALTDQSGKTVRLRDYEGRVVAVEFLYTRCPMAEVCPRLAATFARIRKRFAQRDDLVLLTITLDPKYDTVDVLSRYATIWRAANGGWRFLTGSEDHIQAAAASFGIVYWPEEGVLTHSSNIGVVGRNGKLVALVEGLSFTAQQLGDVLEHALK